MLRKLKKSLYFVVASYFAFWAKLVLERWKPRIIVITGSSGKTTLLHLVEAQLGGQANYSHFANSAIGIPMHILGMSGITSRAQWPSRFLLAPIRTLRKAPVQKLYIVEADCDRPNEGKFLARLLEPEVTIWINSYHTHSMNFDSIVKNKNFVNHKEAIATEFGYFAEAAQKLVIANAGQEEIASQLNRVAQDVRVDRISSKAVSFYSLESGRTLFTVNQQKISLAGLHPKELGISLQMVNSLLDYLGMSFDFDYQKLRMPPGRSSVFKGKRGTTLIDSTYNTGLGATIAVFDLFKNYAASKKWLVIGDILEQGSLEEDEHKRLATKINDLGVAQIILLGSRTHKYTYPLLKSSKPPNVSLLSPKEVLDYMQKNLKGGEVILFKGAMGLEGVIEQLLADSSDAKKLVRREAAWIKRRQAWGLPR